MRVIYYVPFISVYANFENLYSHLLILVDPSDQLSRRKND